MIIKKLICDPQKKYEALLHFPEAKITNRYLGWDLELDLIDVFYQNYSWKFQWFNSELNEFVDINQIYVENKGLAFVLSGYSEVHFITDTVLSLRIETDMFEILLENWKLFHENFETC